MKKSQLLGFILTLFFGPLGLFYSSTPAALAFLAASIGFGLVTGGVGVFFIWFLAIIFGFVTVAGCNDKLELEERRHQEILAATRASKSIEVLRVSPNESDNVKNENWLLSNSTIESWLSNSAIEPQPRNTTSEIA